MDISDTQSAAIARFQAALQIATDWPETALSGSKEWREAESRLKEFQDFLVVSYPAFHTAVERIVLSPYAVLYHWKAKPNAAASSTNTKPSLFLAHYDVVPAEKEHWNTAPFAAELVDGYIYARGALDTKNSLICALEAAEALAVSGFSPERDLWFAFGGDEERSGLRGAQEAAAYFAKQNISFSWALDEGSLISDGIIKGIGVPLALIGVEEKGFLDIELSVSQSPGHASRPPRVQAVAVLGAALARLGRKNFPFALNSTTEAFFSQLAPLMGFPRSFVLSHARLLGPLFFALVGTSPEMAALLRTTLAMTQLSGSPADNVLPSEVRAVLNLRLLPGWEVQQAVDFVRRAVGDERVTVRISPLRQANNPIPAQAGVAEGKGPGWDTLSKAIKSIESEAKILPFLVTATTDSRHYEKLCEAIYRFSPLKLTSREIAGIHGHNERISLANFSAGIRFYSEIIGTN